MRTENSVSERSFCAKVSRSSTSSSTSVTATTEALRGLAVMRAISPNSSPGPSVFSTTWPCEPVCLTTWTSPRRTM